MRRLFTLSWFLLVLAPAVLASAVTNGPVGMTVLGKSYSVYYTTIDYFSITENITPPITASNPGSTTSPNNLVGISSVSSTFLQPWWGNASAAQAAALAWRNASGGWPKNDGVQYPNPSQTAYFAYATVDGGNSVAYAYADTSGNTFTTSQSVDNVSSYALTGPVSE